MYVWGAVPQDTAEADESESDNTDINTNTSTSADDGVRSVAALYSNPIGVPFHDKSPKTLVLLRNGGAEVEPPILAKRWISTQAAKRKQKRVSIFDMSHPSSGPPLGPSLVTVVEGQTSSSSAMAVTNTDIIHLKSKSKKNITKQNIRIRTRTRIQRQEDEDDRIFAEKVSKDYAPLFIQPKVVIGPSKIRSVLSVLFLQLSH